MSRKGSKDLVKKGFAQGEREECVLEGGAYNRLNLFTGV